MDLWKGISWYEGIRVGWLLLWRGFLVYMAVSFLLVIFVVLIGKLFRIPPPFPSGVGLILGPLVLLIGWSIGWPILISQMLRKKFKGFHLAMVRESGSPLGMPPSTY